MADAFISYAREDQPFVRALSAALEARQRDAWVDWEGIPPTAEWLTEIRAAIDAADTFLFVLSPDSLASEICTLEVDHAVLHNKRLVPVLRREGGGQDVHAALSKLNWIFMREHDDLEGAVDTLIEALDTDLAHVKLHTHYLKRALAWQQAGFDNSFALRGSDLGVAEGWLTDSGGKAPQPTSLHNRYILDSRRATTLRQRITGAAIAAGLLIAVVLGLIALQEREAKRQNQERAIANQLVGESRLALDERDDGLEDSVHLAAEAMRRLSALGERSLAVDQALRRGLALLPLPPSVTKVATLGETRALGFSATGAHLARATSLGAIEVVAVNTGRPVGSWTMPLKAGDTLRAIALDPSGTRVAVRKHDSGLGRSQLSLWDVASGAELAICNSERDGDFLSPGGALGPVSNLKGQLWIDHGIWRFEGCQTWALWGEQTIVGAIALSLDGSRLAATVRERGGKERWIEIRDAETGTLATRWRHSQFVRHLWWLDGGRQLATAGLTASDLEFWDVDSPGQPRAVQFAEPVAAVRADGGVVATLDRDTAIVRIRSAADGGEIARLVHSGSVSTAAFSADGRTLSTVVGKALWRWPLDAPPSAADLGPNAPRQLAAVDDVAARRDLAAQLGLSGQTVLATAPCPDPKTLAVTWGSSTRGGWQGRTGVWVMPEARQLISFDLLETLGRGQRGIDDRASTLLACSADGRQLALPARDAVVVREIAGGKVIARLPHPGVHAAAFAPDGKFIVTAGRGPVRVWQLSTGAEVARLLDDARVERVAFSDDGRTLATRTADGTRSFLWQPQQLIDEACARLPGSLPTDTWQRLFPDVAYVATCPVPGQVGKSTP